MSKKCIGCGALLQSNYPNEIGYVNSSVYDRSLYCERCFRMIHYNERIELSLPNMNKVLLSKINKCNGFIYFMIDLLNINRESMDTFKKIQKDKCLVISKYDILPKSFQDQKIIRMLEDEYGVDCNIIFLSTKKNISTNKILRDVLNKGYNKVYFTGYTNSGKSTLLNKILENYHMNHHITTSSNPNTTVDFIKVELDDIVIYDTPGFVFEHSLYDNDYQFVNKLFCKKEIKPITMQVKNDGIVTIENMFYFTSKDCINYTFYMSNELSIQKIFQNNFGNLEYQEYSIPRNSDIVIQGMGFINIKKECTIRIYSDYLYCIEIRKSMF